MLRQKFQSLSRDSGRLNSPTNRYIALMQPCVSIPQSGFGAFERATSASNTRRTTIVSIPQSGFGAFEPTAPTTRSGAAPAVSIPQSGFGAFELVQEVKDAPASISVSIPQSGFGAFEPGQFFWSYIAYPRVSIPQSGFGAFELHPTAGLHAAGEMFQSLSRDSGRLNLSVIVPPPTVGLFQSLSRDSGRLNLAFLRGVKCGDWRFNPSVGIRGV